jgi:DNA-binding beta-propeller fold protein YncE
MTSVSDDQVAVSVSLSDGRAQIQFFKVSASGVIKKTKKLFNVEHDYSDIVQSKGYIYGLDSDSIDKLNMTGKIVRTIEIPVDENKFNDYEEIALSPDGLTIYVTNSWGSRKVISMTLDGTIKAVYKDEDLCEPHSITVDKHGLVYVGSFNNIHQLTADLNKIRVLQDDCYHDNLTYSSTENKLYYNSDNKIKSYSLDFK